MKGEKKSYLLSDIINIIGGGTPKRSVPEYWNGDIDWLSVVDFNSSSRFIENSKEKITELGLKKSSTRILDTGQIIISARGTVGCLAQLKKPMAFNQSCYGLDGKSDFVENDYLYYLLTCKIDELQRKTHGAVFDTITRETFKFIEVLLPSIKEQKKISTTLGALDKKIALNTKTNETLEKLAQAIFKSWFVDFDPVKAKEKLKKEGGDLDSISKELGMSKEILELFPDEFEESEMDLIPNGWALKPLYETAEYINGSAFKATDFSDNNEGLPIIKIAELKQGVSTGTKFTLNEVKSKYFIDSGDVLYSWSGSPETSLEVFKWHGGKGWLNQHIFKLNFDSIQQRNFTYFLLKQIKPLLISTAKQKQTTGLGHITVADMKRIKITYPDNKVLKKFSEQINPIYERSSMLIEEIKSLTELRDTLLPKLLSGEVTINDPEANT